MDVGETAARLRQLTELAWRCDDLAPWARDPDNWLHLAAYLAAVLAAVCVVSR